jgi:isocitrate dehydrogenase kinase/phosphatase
MTPSTDAEMALAVATELNRAFLVYNTEFRVITRRARSRFERREWHEGQADAAERIGLYDLHVDRSVQDLHSRLGLRAQDRGLWQSAKRDFAAMVANYPDLEFTKTYFSSVARRACKIRGLEPDIEFTGEETIPLRNIGGPLIGRNYFNSGSLVFMFETLIRDFAWSTPFAHAGRCAQFLADQVNAHFRSKLTGDAVVCIDVMAPVFYRDTRAYVIGKATGWTHSSPIVIAFASTENGIIVDAVVMTEDGVELMFGFARSYFHVDVEPVGAAIVFLRKVIPRETVHELFTILGRAKQGKTERYRGFGRHLQYSRDQFVVTPGKKGMVMTVFTLPSYDVVFKVIRDKFPFPKNTSNEEVRQRYRLVAHHDKVGRLVDAQEFRMLRFAKDRFEPGLLAELLGETALTTSLDGDTLLIQHAYVERRLRPLDIYLREVDQPTAVRAVLDYGQALRDLASANVFPGDLLMKNFGVNRAGRVIFYDYDELCLLIDCNFREMPRPRDYDDEMASEPWFSVGEHDVFPEEFAPFLGLSPQLLDVFQGAHGDLLTARYWQTMQARIHRGEVIELLPY